MHLVEGRLDEKATPFVVFPRVAERLARKIDPLYGRSYRDISSYAMPAEQDNSSLNRRFSVDIHISIDPFLMTSLPGSSPFFNIFLIYYYLVVALGISREISLISKFPRLLSIL